MIRIVFTALCGLVLMSAGMKADPPSTSPATRPWYKAVDNQFTDIEADSVKDLPDRDLAYDYAGNSYGDPHLDRATAYTVLLKTNTFTWAAVGAGAITPPHWHALKTLVKRDDAREVFLDLLDRARFPAGKLWALAGLQVVDRGEFDKRIKPFLDSQEEVLTQRGCLGGVEKVGKVARGIIDQSRWYNAYLLDPR